MLLDDDSEEDLKQLAAAIAAGYNIVLIGRKATFRINGRVVEITLPVEARNLPILRQAYMAGKAAREVGSRNIRNMNADQISEAIRVSNVTLNEADDAVIARLERDTAGFLEGRAEAWRTQISTVLSNADREYAAAIAAEAYNDVGEIAEERQLFLKRLVSQMDELFPGFKAEAYRLLQTETSNYFQHGQTTGRSKDEIVYKEVRAGCCIHCQRLHVDRKGRPKKYKLGDVQGNSNYGRKAADWRFTIGPVHPHCYCVLVYESDEKAKAA